MKKVNGLLYTNYEKFNPFGSAPIRWKFDPNKHNEVRQFIILLEEKLRLVGLSEEEIKDVEQYILRKLEI